MTNRYFPFPLPNSKSKLWDIVVQKESTVMINIQETKMIVKLDEHDIKNHPILNGIPEYTNEGITQYIADNYFEWNTLIL